MKILKHYANLSVGQTHYRRAGQGQAMVLLHASPMSSKFMEPLMQTVQASVDVIAPDTPGYGASDPLPKDILASQSGLEPYVNWLYEFLEVANLGPIILYGSATGAQIAIEFAKAHPEKISHLVLENAAHFEPTEVEDVMQHYFPSLEPQADGRHLQDTWAMARGVFKWFPWYAQDDEHLVNEHEPPAELVHATAMAYLNAGVDYAQAYQRAFQNEKFERMLTVTVPTTFVKWSGSIVRSYVDRIEQFEVPANFSVETIDGDIAARMTAIESLVNSLTH